VRFVMLHFRSRSVGYAVAALIVVAFLEWSGAQLLLMRPGAAPQSATIPLFLFAPLAVACIAGASTHNPFGEMERTSSYPLPALRLFHLTGLLVCGSVLLSVIAGGWSLPNADLIVVRNILGLSGAAFIAAHVFGSGLSWTLPLTYVAAVHLAGQAPNGEWSLWAWPAQPLASVPSSFIAITLLLAGLLVVCLLESRKLPTWLQ